MGIERPIGPSGTASKAIQLVGTVIMSRARLISLAVTAAIFLSATCAVRAAEALAPLFEAAQAPGQSGHSAGVDRGNSRAVRVNRTALGKSRMLLNLGVGPDLDVVRERAAEQPHGRTAWIGRVKGDPDSSVVLASSGQAVAGTIRHHGRLYKLVPTAAGGQSIEEVGQADPLPPAPDAVPDVIGSGSAGTPSGAAASADGTVVDVMIAYTPEAKASYGGTDGVQALAMLAVEESNQAYQNSQVPMQLRLVEVVEANYHDSGDMNVDLNRLTVATDGYLDALSARRDAVGADLVSLLVGSGNYCGLSWQLGALNPAWADYGFSVVHTACATGYYTFGHELGHNLGLSHDHANSSYGMKPYSFGYQDPSSAFRTVMAYSCVSGCTRIQHFSNPEVSYAGRPTGVAGWADAALALSESAPVVATWRASQAEALPFSPNDLNALTLSDTRIDLHWTDTGLAETGYRVERSTDGLNFTTVATLGANSTGFADEGLAAQTTYIYRVSAFNGTGVATPSNEAWATTAPAPIPAPIAPSNLRATTLSPSEIALSWSDNAEDETGFALERSGNQGATWQPLTSLPANATAYTDQGLTAATGYSYRVSATGTGDASTNSAVATATTQALPPQPPVAPSALSASALSSSAIALAWTDNAINEAGYQVDRSTNGGLSWATAASLAANTRAYTDQDLAAGTYYRYRVRATGTTGVSAYSNEAGVTTLVPPSSCAGATTLTLADKTTTWSLRNTGTTDLTLIGIEITWPTAQGTITRIKLAKNEIWAGQLAPAAATLTSGWNATTARRVIKVGARADLVFEYPVAYKKDVAGDYHIIARFNNGCSAQF